ncbi:hypothetical protein HY469_02900 [Candidatus Roizmanbacteria bacterium]|nr:hypothetical protein [Candidatus Roizmanbacteria bacterium]
MNKISSELTFRVSKIYLNYLGTVLNRHAVFTLLMVLTGISIYCFIYYLNNGLGIAYNDARSHLDIGRRVVEGLKPGLAQLGSVWLPLTHVLMVPTIWNDFMWHSGLAGALQSMASFVATALVIYFFLQKLGAGLFARLVGVAVFVANINILYLQSTAMTELLLLATMTLGVYELVLWSKKELPISLIKSSFWIMLSTLIRYDGWFLLFMASLLILVKTVKDKGYKATEGTYIFFCSLGGLGIALWLLWNLLIFKDPLFFAFGPYSAHAQQTQLDEAGVLATKHELWLSIKIYFYALMYNSYGITVVFGVIGAVMVYLDKKISVNTRLMLLSLLAPFIFNVIALYLGHSVLFIQGLSGDTWFNARYGIMMMPSLAVFVGYLIHRAGYFKYSIAGIWFFVIVFAFANYDAVTIDDARVGSSQKNVTEVSGWLRENAADREGFVLISAASHDAIIFSSGLPMKRFIHEGTGKYWESATSYPDQWARWIIMRTNDMNDMTFNTVSKTGALPKYELVGQYPFADIYELRPEYVTQVNTEPVYGKQK